MLDHVGSCWIMKNVSCSKGKIFRRNVPSRASSLDVLQRYLIISHTQQQSIVHHWYIGLLLRTVDSHGGKWKLAFRFASVRNSICTSSEFKHALWTYLFLLPVVTSIAQTGEKERAVALKAMKRGRKEMAGVTMIMKRYLPTGETRLDHAVTYVDHTSTLLA